MGEDIKWLIGISVTIFLFWASMLGGVFWRIMATIKRVEDQVKEGDNALHARVNRLREDTVSKSDLSALGNDLREGMREMRQEHRKSSDNTNARLDTLLAAIATRNHGESK